jgi:hypothetical protein
LNLLSIRRELSDEANAAARHVRGC